MTFDRFDYQPVKLIELKGEDKGEMVSGSVINANMSGHFKMTDTLTPSQIEYVKFMVRQVDDTTMKRTLIRLLKRNHVQFE